MKRHIKQDDEGRVAKIRKTGQKEKTYRTKRNAPKHLGTLVIGKTRCQEEKGDEANKMKVSVESHDLEISFSETKKRMRVQVMAARKKIPIPRILDFVFRIFGRIGGNRGHHRGYYSDFERENRVSIHEAFPIDNPTKEMLEVGSMAYHINQLLDYELRMDHDVNCYVIGDGVMPSCGIALLYSTNWRVTVSDPAMRRQWIDRKISHRFSCDNRMGEDVRFEDDRKMTVVVNVHSHANLPVIMENNRRIRNMFVLSIPCCYPETQVVRDVEPCFQT